MPLICIGHNGEIFAARFDPAGHLIASGSMDRSISKSFARLSLLCNKYDRRSSNNSIPSAVADIRTMRELWSSHWTQGRYPRPTVVSRFESGVLSLGRHDYSKLGPRDRTQD